MRVGPSGKLTAEVLIDAFELWYWRRHLRVPWNAKRSNHSILKEISPEYSLEGLMLKLKLQYFGHLMRRTDSWKKTLMLGETEGRRRWQTEDEMVGWHRWTWVWASSGSWWWTGKPGMLQSTGHKDSDMTERLNWTELRMIAHDYFLSPIIQNRSLSSDQEWRRRRRDIQCTSEEVKYDNVGNFFLYNRNELAEYGCH